MKRVVLSLKAKETKGGAGMNKTTRIMIALFAALVLMAPQVLAAPSDWVKIEHGYIAQMDDIHYGSSSSATCEVVYGEPKHDEMIAALDESVEYDRVVAASSCTGSGSALRAKDLQVPNEAGIWDYR
jgi:hypothetical protein